MLKGVALSQEEGHLSHDPVGCFSSDIWYLQVKYIYTAYFPPRLSPLSASYLYNKKFLKHNQQQQQKLHLEIDNAEYFVPAKRIWLK